MTFITHREVASDVEQLSRTLATKNVGKGTRVGIYGWVANLSQFKMHLVHTSHEGSNAMSG